MLVIDVSGADIKAVMNLLLRETTFDRFETRGVEVCVFTRFTATGILDKDALPEGERENPKRSYCLWGELRPYVYDWIKGGKTPKSIKIVFAAGDDAAAAAHPNAAAMFLNIGYENGVIRFTTSTAQKSFSLDKTHEEIWDQRIINFFRKYLPNVSTQQE